MMASMLRFKIYFIKQAKWRGLGTRGKKFLTSEIHISAA
jgi:hypothetical protein